MKSKTTLIVVVLALTLVAGWGIYQLYNKVDSNPPIQNNLIEQSYRQSNYYLSRYIGFNATQQKQYQTLEDNYRHELILLKDKISDLEIEIMGELKEDEPDMELLHKFTQEVGKAHTTIKELTINHFLTIKEICTPEQKNKISILFSRIEQKSEIGRRHQGGRGGRGKGMGQGRRWRFRQDSVRN